MTCGTQPSHSRPVANRKEGILGATLCCFGTSVTETQREWQVFGKEDFNIIASIVYLVNELINKRINVSPL